MQYYIILATVILIASVILPKPFHELSPAMLFDQLFKKISVILRHRLHNTTKDKQTTWYLPRKKK